MSLRVSDHALVRFVSRTGFCELERLRAELEVSLTRAAEAAGKIGSTDYRIIADGLEYVISDGVVTTVVMRRGAGK